MKIDKKIKIFAIVAGVFLFLMSFSVYLVFSHPRNFAQGHIIHIEEGSTLNEISLDLRKQRIIKHPEIFRLVVQYMFGEKSIKAGDYFFEKSLSAYDVAKRLTKGEYQLEPIKVTIFEGTDIDDMAVMFEDLGMWQKEDFWDEVGLPAVDYRTVESLDSGPKDFSSVTSLLADKPNYVSLEGYLFPDTYFFPPNITPEGVVIAMLKNLDEKIDAQLRQAIEESDHSVFEILTMASLLEKEAAKLEDKKLISGILWKRLGDDFPLQVDAPFVYVINKNTFQLTKDDLKIDSLYNTYRYPGLPLGPIANPGLDSIKAALYPEASPHWYYLSDKQHNVYYSETFEEHKIKKAKYL